MVVWLKVLLVNYHLGRYLDIITSVVIRRGGAVQWSTAGSVGQV